MAMREPTPFHELSDSELETAISESRSFVDRAWQLDPKSEGWPFHSLRAALMSSELRRRKRGGLVVRPVESRRVCEARQGASFRHDGGGMIF